MATRSRASQYIQHVVDKELHDPVLSFQLANGLHVRHVIKNYEPKDMESGAAATLLEWINIHYEKDPQARKFDREVRVGTVQWQMRPAATLWSFCRQMAAFGYFGEYVLINKLP